jgi:hypothetical protein
MELHYVVVAGRSACVPRTPGHQDSQLCASASRAPCRFPRLQCAVHCSVSTLCIVKRVTASALHCTTAKGKRGTVFTVRVTTHQVLPLSGQGPVRCRRSVPSEVRWCGGNGGQLWGWNGQTHGQRCARASREGAASIRTSHEPAEQRGRGYEMRSDLARTCLDAAAGEPRFLHCRARHLGQACPHQLSCDLCRAYHALGTVQVPRRKIICCDEPGFHCACNLRVNAPTRLTQALSALYPCSSP